MQIDADKIEILNKVWDVESPTLLLLFSTLNKVEVLNDYVNLTRLIVFLREKDVELDYTFGAVDHLGRILKITSSTRVYGITRSLKGFYKGDIIYFLGDIFTFTAPDDIELAEYIKTSAFLLRFTYGPNP